MAKTAWAKGLRVCFGLGLALMTLALSAPNPAPTAGSPTAQSSPNGTQPSPTASGSSEPTVAPTDTPRPSPTPSPTPEAIPVERFIYAPPISLENPSGQIHKHDTKKWRFTLLVVGGTWNEPTLWLWNEISKMEYVLLGKKIRPVFIFSHDSLDTLSTFLNKNQSSLTSGLDRSEFIEVMKNPKIPTIFVISHKNRFILKKEMPSKDDLLEIIKKLELWTEF